MKRTPIRPGRKSLARRAMPRRSGPIKAKGRRRFPRGEDRAYQAWIRSLPCHLARRGRCRGVVEACHVKSKGAGGGDRGNLLPLCTAHHREQHDRGIATFAQRYGLDLGQVAGLLDAVYAGRGGLLASITLEEGE